MTLFWHSFWHTTACVCVYIYIYICVYTYICTFSHSIWHSFWHILWHSVWHLFWHTFWHICWHSFSHSICFFLSFYLASILTFNSAMLSDIKLYSRILSGIYYDILSDMGTAGPQPRQCPLRSGARGWGRRKEADGRTNLPGRATKKQKNPWFSLHQGPNRPNAQFFEAGSMPPWAPTPSSRCPEIPTWHLRPGVWKGWNLIPRRGRPWMRLGVG